MAQEPDHPPPSPILQVEDVEVDLLLEAIYRKYGYDFRNYARASIKRRILNQLAEAGLETISELQSVILRDEGFFREFVVHLTVNVSEMFRDPAFFRAVRELVIPVLKTYPFLRIWHAGCSTGQEVYSMAIVLHEEGLLKRTRIYATDVNEEVLRIAREGIFPAKKMQEYTANYQKAGGKESFANYYSARYGLTILEPWLREGIVFAAHNLVTDGCFGEMNAIFCRNVLIYFNMELKNRVIGLFHESLVHGGFLCLGSKESLIHTKYADAFEEVRSGTKIYRKIGL